MPWKETDEMKERVKFVLAWERLWAEGEGRTNLSALCRAFGISRETAYYWLERYQAAGHDLKAIVSQSRRPRTSPTKVGEEMEDLVVRARKRYPTWGPRKLRAWLVGRFEDLDLPAASTMAAILKRNGLTRPRRRRVRTPPHTEPFAECKGPNAVWCVDFKGHFLTGDRTRIDPLTITDADSRYLIRCEAVARPRGGEAREVFESAFEEYGLPVAIRSDNGPPFASNGAGGLTELSVWWIGLGIRPERIDAGHPEQNGRHERMHLTLKLETAMPPERTLLAQQRAFDRFRRIYNEERPHEAIDNRTPASRYEPSPRRMPKLARMEPAVGAEVVRVDALGRFRWGRSTVLANQALRGLFVELWPADERHWEVRYGPVVLGLLDVSRPGRGLIRPRPSRRRGHR